MPEYIFSPRAREDALDIALYIASDNPKAGEVFYSALEHACDQLARMPNMGKARTFRNSRLQDMRMFPVPKFHKYLIFYRLIQEGIEVVRVVHGARDLPVLFGK
jgi:toxin ParE1/3/4